MKKIILTVVLPLILLLLSHRSDAQTWTQVGSADNNSLSSSVSDYPTIGYVGHTLYVAYWNNASVANNAVLGNLVVKRLSADGQSWESIGDDLYINSTAMKVYIAYSGDTPFIVYPGDGIYAGGIKKLNPAGNGWETVDMNATGLAGLQLTHAANIAFHDNTEYKVNVAEDGYTLTLTRLNAQGTAWETAGPAFTAESRPYTISIAFNGSTPYVSYNASFADGLKANVKKLNAAGTAWETVGSQNFSTSQGAGISLTDNGLTILFDNGVPYVSLIPKPSRNSFGIPILLKLNGAGNGWDNVGNTADFTGVQAQYLDVAFNNHVPYIAYSDQSYGRISVKRLSASGTGWETVGLTNFTGMGAIFPALAFVENMPYLAYTDHVDHSNVKVKKLNATATEWVSVGGGPGFIPIRYGFNAGQSYVLYADGNNKASVKRLNSATSTWETVGNASFSAGTIAGGDLTFNGSMPYVIFQDESIGNKATVMKLNASNAWEVVGKAGFTSAYPDYPSLQFNNGVPYAVYTDYNNSNKATVMKLNAAGTDWELVGTGGLSPGAAASPSRGFSGTSLYVAFADGSNSGKLAVRKFNATSNTWDAVGAGILSAGAVQYVDLVVDNSTPYVAFNDGGSANKLNVIQLNGAGTWVPVGNVNFTDGGATALSLLFNKNIPYVSFADLNKGGGKASVMKLNTLSTAWENLGDPGFSFLPVTASALGFNGSTVYAMYTSGDAYVKKFIDNTNPEPTITAFTPQSASVGNTINITGTHFTSASAVTFGGVPAASFTVILPTSITAVTGAGNSGDISITTPGGTATISGFLLNTAPVITSFTPTISGSQGVITISGNNLTGATTVSFGGTAAQSFTVASANSITAVLAAGASGNVSVTTPYGIASSKGFIFVPKPTITPSGSTTFASGGNVTLSVNTDSGYTYQWYQDGTIITAANSAGYRATENGSYTVKLMAGSYAVTSDPVIVKVVYTLPAENFKVSVTSVTCKGQPDGAIGIEAAKLLNYTAIQQNYRFNTSLNISGLTAGTYQVCLAVDGQPDYKQCYDLIITEPQDLSVYSSVDKTFNTVNLSLNGGYSYQIDLNGNTTTTNSNHITLQLARGSNTLAVTTEKLCQGTIRQVINMSGNLAPYPNPFQNILYVNLGESKVAVAGIKIYNVTTGQLIKTSNYYHQSGVVQLDVTNLNNGVYTFRLSLDNKASDFKIVKR
jgi:hypothetical protein